MAVETYLGTNSTTTIPATGIGSERYEETLVAASLIRQTSEYWNVGANGDIINVLPC